MKYQAIVFKAAPQVADFTCSKKIALPGRHPKRRAWAAVFAALRRDRTLIGGNVETVFAESDAEADAETLANP